MLKSYVNFFIRNFCITSRTIASLLCTYFDELQSSSIMLNFQFFFFGHILKSRKNI